MAKKPAAGKKKPAGKGPETQHFQAEVSRLLDIVVHSLYSEREIFLRELISNASDACDRLRYAALTDASLTAGDTEFRIEISIDKDARTITVSDNGTGMTRDELVENLGTIARSGTAAFLDQMAEGTGKDVSLIGQFGVGFYASFMVADRVAVITRAAGDDSAWRWTSDGKGEFTVEPAERPGRGTSITLHIKDDAEEYLAAERLRQIIKTYSDHIPFPIMLAGEQDDATAETVNEASALWTRPRDKVDQSQYTEFYHHTAHAMDDPWLTMHFKAEGVIEYTGLLFVPGARPFDLFHPDRKQAVKLYVKRVFITEDCDELLPPWLRFLRGIIDTEDLNLNVSREMLQNNPVVAKIRAGLCSRVLGELAKKAEKEPDEYATFWENFGAVLKEGLYEDFEHREKLLTIARFHSTASESVTSLADYVSRMRDGQDAIYYISGEDLDAVSRSPQLEGFRSRGVEVLLLTDPVDEFWIPSVGVYDAKPFKSVTRGSDDLSKIKPADSTDADGDDDAAVPEGLDSLIALLKLSLGDSVKDVRGSQRLTDSAVCLVADDSDMDIRLERLLKQHNQLSTTATRILEINPKHALIRRLADAAQRDGASDDLADVAMLLLDQARIMEGEAVTDPAAYARRMETMMERGIPA
jgi:molecular chaperone HtpG